jgi:hypothetical protein
MKFNWGVGIFILYTGFALLTIGLVVFSMTKKVDLVTDNYYDKELKYQQQIEREKNSNSLDKKIRIEINAKELKISFPEFVNPDSVKGTIHFYRPSDSGKDFILNIALEKNKKQRIILSKLDKGIWKLQINWSCNNREYYYEESVFI